MARTDVELVEATLEGDKQAFAAIVERYQRLIFGIIYHYLGPRAEVEDLAQEVFLKVFRALNRFDTSRPLKTWISRIAANTCLDELRRRRHHRLQLFADLTPEDDDRIEDFFERFLHRSPPMESERAELFSLLERAMDRLHEKDKLAFVLREIEGLTYPEMAEVFETTELATRIRVSRARKKLQDDLHRILYSSKRKPTHE